MPPPGASGPDPLAALCRWAALNPADAEAQGTLASALHERGQWAEAASAYERTLQLAPELHAARNNLGNVYGALGRHSDAVLAFQRVLASTPNDAEVHSNLSNALMRLGRSADASAAARRALALDPSLAAAHNNLGVALAAQGDFAAAIASYTQALRLDPRDADAWSNLGNAHRDLGHLREAVASFSRALRAAPQRPAYHHNLGNALLDLGRLEEAADCYRRALALQPEHAGAARTLAMVLRRLGRPEEAESHCRAALAVEPDSAETLAFLGELRADRGDFTAAQALFRQAIAHDPEAPTAWFGIASHRKMSAADSDWRAATERLAAKPLPLRHAIGLRYARGKYFDDIGEYDAAFAEYRQANELSKRYGARYDAARLAARVEDLIARPVAPRRIATESARSATVEPAVFVLGMPRSGTSLTEQILASHPAVFGAGELTYWDMASARCEAPAVAAGGAPGGAVTVADSAPTASREELLARLAAGFRERLAALAPDALRVIDKMPANFMNVGLIHAALPHARFLHMQRHPADTCLSIYFQYFANSHPYAHDLATLAHYYVQYGRLVAHWRRVLPAANWLDVSYEGLVADQEGWTRRMLDFLDLPWDPRCLDFQRTDRVVTTTSKWQVRQKIHGASSGRWRHYERHLGPLRELMELAQPTAT
jgi:tetratricopeptide (TPR) repeat protein